MMNVKAKAQYRKLKQMQCLYCRCVLLLGMHVCMEGEACIMYAIYLSEQSSHSIIWTDSILPFRMKLNGLEVRMKR